MKSWQRTAKAPKDASLRSRVHIGDLRGVHVPQELAGGVGVELGVRCFDAEKVAIARGKGKARDVEHRMVWLGQAVQDEDAGHGGQHGAEDGALEGDGDERGPRIVRSPADVEGVFDGRDPVLKKEAAETA